MMKHLDNLEFWFLTGSQDLYGEEPLRQVAADAQKIVDALNSSKTLPFKLVCKPVQKAAAQIRATIQQAGYEDRKSVV